MNLKNIKVKKFKSNENNFLSTKLGKMVVNRVMQDGKKIKAEKIVLEVLSFLEEVSTENPIDIITLAIKHATPVVEVRTIRIRGANYKVPAPILAKRRISLAIKCIVKNARSTKGIPMKIALRNELFLAYNKQGESMKKKYEMHKLARANRAFTHFRWF